MMATTTETLREAATILRDIHGGGAFDRDPADVYRVADALDEIALTSPTCPATPTRSQPKPATELRIPTKWQALAWSVLHGTTLNARDSARTLARFVLGED